MLRWRSFTVFQVQATNQLCPPCPRPCRGARGRFAAIRVGSRAGRRRRRRRAHVGAKGGGCRSARGWGGWGGGAPGMEAGRWGVVPGGSGGKRHPHHSRAVWILPSAAAGTPRSACAASHLTAYSCRTCKQMTRTTRMSATTAATTTCVCFGGIRSLGQELLSLHACVPPLSTHRQPLPSIPASRRSRQSAGSLPPMYNGRPTRLSPASLPLLLRFRTTTRRSCWLSWTASSRSGQSRRHARWGLPEGRLGGLPCLWPVAPDLAFVPIRTATMCCCGVHVATCCPGWPADSADRGPLRAAGGGGRGKGGGRGARGARARQPAAAGEAGGAE